jgi:hypothetical protein
VVRRLLPFAVKPKNNHTFPRGSAKDDTNPLPIRVALRLARKWLAE